MQWQLTDFYRRATLALNGLSGKGKKREKTLITKSNETLIKRKEDVNYHMSDLLKRSWWKKDENKDNYEQNNNHLPENQPITLTQEIN